MEKKEDYFFRPRSLKMGARYKVYFDGSGETFEAQGFDLACRGFYVRFHASELVSFEEL
jgi:hypothetical protein